MKKIIIILFTILQTWNIGMATEPDTLIVKGDSIVYDSNGKEKWRNTSDGTITRVTNNGITAVVTAIEIGIDTICYIQQPDSVENSFCVEVVYPLVWYKEKYSELKSDIFTNKGKVISIEKDGSIKYSGILSSLYFLAILALMLVAVIVFLVLWIHSKKAAKKQKSQLQSEVKGLKEKLDWGQKEKIGLSNTANSLSSENRILKGDIERLNIEINRLTQQIIIPSEPSVLLLNQSTKKYADSIVDGKFNKVTDQANDDTVFELFLKRADDRDAEFVIYENAKRRVLKNADFIDGCEKSRINPSPVDLQVESGITTLQENGKWQITQKAKVKFV